MAAILQKTSVDDFLGTNYTPNDVEIKEIKQCISEPLQRLKAIEDETNILELRLKRLHRESADIRTLIASHQALLTPIRHLPLELLREIFVACLPVDRNPTMCSDEAPILLTRISNQWRNVALTTPRLWAAIHIPVPQFEYMAVRFLGEMKHQKVTRTRAVGVNEFLSRSGSLPLSISVQFTHWNLHPSDGRTNELLDCIIPLASRWKDMTFVGPSVSLAQIHELQSEFPQLRTLRLNMSQNNNLNAGVISWKESALVKAKGLRSFSISSSTDDIANFPVIWSQLTDLTLKTNDWISPTSVLKSRDIHNILRMSPALISCNIYVKHDDLDPNAVLLTVSLKYLEILTIEEPTQYPKFFASFDVPSLTTLEYSPSSSHRSGPSSLLALLSNLSNSNRLEKLTTIPRLFDSGEFVDILRHCGSLRLLSVCQPSPFFPSAVDDQDLAVNNPIDDALLRALAPNEEPQGISDTNIPEIVESTNQLCPKLEEFMISMASNVSEHGILDFISRKQSIGDEHPDKSNKLKNIDICFYRPKVHDIMPHLSAFIASGLKVRIRYPPRTLRGQFSLYDGLPYQGEQDPYNLLWR